MSQATVVDLKQGSEAESSVASKSEAESSTTTPASSPELSPLQMLSNLSSTILTEDPEKKVQNAAALSEDVKSVESHDAPEAEVPKDSSAGSPNNHSHYSGRHGNWTPEEDALLLKLVEKYDTARTKQWTYIAKMMGTGRIGKQCRDRYLNHTGPNVVKAPWTPEEDRIIILSQKLYGNSWTRIAGILGNGRPANGIKNRWNSCLRHRYLEIDGESLDDALAKGHVNSNGVITVQKARKRPSGRSAVVETDTPEFVEASRPCKQRRESTAHVNNAEEASNGSVAQTVSSPESPKLPTSPVLGGMSPLFAVSSPQVSAPVCPSIAAPGAVPNSLMYQAMCTPFGSFAAVPPNFISIHPASMLMNSPFFSAASLFPALLQQQQQQQQAQQQHPVAIGMPAQSLASVAASVTAPSLN